jgi:hypothetical protein
MKWQPAVIQLGNARPSLGDFPKATHRLAGPNRDHGAELMRSLYVK